MAAVTVERASEKEATIDTGPVIGEVAEDRTAVEVQKGEESNIGELKSRMVKPQVARPLGSPKIESEIMRDYQLQDNKSPRME